MQTVKVKRDWIKSWRRGPYSLRLWDTHRRDNYGKCVLGYRFRFKGEVIFEGEDYSPGVSMGIDSLESVYGLLGFLSVQDGDVDADYFKNYTPRQLEFARLEGERLGLLVSDFDEKMEKRCNQ